MHDFTFMRVSIIFIVTLQYLLPYLLLKYRINNIEIYMSNHVEIILVAS